MMLIEIWMTSNGPYYWNEFLRKVNHGKKKKFILKENNYAKQNGFYEH